MPASKPTIYLIAGCNGAGKTTFAKEFLPHEVKCLRFYNADEIARGLSPLDPSAGAIKAGRLLLSEVRDSITRHETFALESTLSGKTYVRIFQRAFSLGFELELHYLWLSKLSRRSRACAAAFAWEDTMFQPRTSAVVSCVASITWLMIIFLLRLVGRSGTIVDSPRNASRLPRPMM